MAFSSLLDIASHDCHVLHHVSREIPNMNSEDLDFRTMGSVDMTVLRSVNVDNTRALTALSSFMDDSKLSTHVDPETKAILLKLQSSLQN